MWDVKPNWEVHKTEIWKRFTLTMWDVKRISIEGDFFIQYEFYLNYVGCKGVKSSRTSGTVMRFTLTMWDVKQG